MKTKEFLDRISISESTLRRWISKGTPFPEFMKIERDWIGQRNWTEKHVNMVIQYKNERLKRLNKKVKK